MQNKDLSRYLTARTEDLRKALNEIITIRSDSAWLFVPEQLDRKVCLVAHIDTVHPENWDAKLLVHENGIIRSPQGLGADDRAGVWAALEIFLTAPPEHQPYVLLTDKEEVGCIGAREAAAAFGNILRSDVITYFIELDRQGSDDAVFYCNEPADFRHFVTSFGFREAPGTFSDIGVIGPASEKCAVNLSTGYYNAHTLQEYLVVSELEETVKRVRMMLKENAINSRVWTNTAHYQFMHRGAEQRHYVPAWKGEIRGEPKP